MLYDTPPTQAGSTAPIHTIRILMAGIDEPFTVHGFGRVLRGQDGLPGKDGLDGANGQNGKDGIDGQNGQNGVDGKDGLNGKDGINGQNGRDGVDGQDGRDGINGVDGKDGLDGLAGAVFRTQLVNAFVDDMASIPQSDWLTQADLTTNVIVHEETELARYVATPIKTQTVVPDAHAWVGIVSNQSVLGVHYMNPHGTINAAKEQDTEMQVLLFTDNPEVVLSFQPFQNSLTVFHKVENTFVAQNSVMAQEETSQNLDWMAMMKSEGFAVVDTSTDNLIRITTAFYDKQMVQQTFTFNKAENGLTHNITGLGVGSLNMYLQTDYATEFAALLGFVCHDTALPSYFKTAKVLKYVEI
jgi:hypothetical protein